MPFVENKFKKFITYFIKECANLLKKEVKAEGQQSMLELKIYDALSRLSKEKRTKNNLQILLFGLRPKILKLFQKLEIKDQNFEWGDLSDLQEKIRMKICSKYQEKNTELWENYKKYHQKQSHEDLSRMEIYVRHVIVEKKLKWEETGTRRMNLRRIEHQLLSQSNQSQNNDTVMEQLEEAQTGIPQFHQNTINLQCQQQSSAESSQWFQDPQMDFGNILNYLDEDYEWNNQFWDEQK